MLSENGVGSGANVNMDPKHIQPHDRQLLLVPGTESGYVDRQ